MKPVWAGYLSDWSGPAEGERPAAYIVILGDTELRKDFGCDHGIAAQSIMLGATERGLGGCMIGSIDRSELRQVRDPANPGAGQASGDSGAGGRGSWWGHQVLPG